MLSSRTAAPALLCLSVLMAACQKKPAEPVAEAAPAPTAAAAPAPAPAPEPEPSADDAEKARRQAMLDFATMEDGFLNDAKSQWASTAKASSSYGETPASPPESPEKSLAWRATGTPDGEAWSQFSQDIGLDWLQAGFAKPVQATEVRIVMLQDDAAEAITKLELVDTDGKATTVWSGLSDQKPDRRGSRTWFVRKFDKTAGKIAAVKMTFANNVAVGYKEIDAVQLVGE